MNKNMRIKCSGLLSCLAVVIFAATWPTIANGEVSSRNNRQLRAALKRYPAADTNKDGVLTMSEARAHMRRMAGGGDKGKDKGTGKQPETTKKTDKDGTTVITNAKYGLHQRQVMDLWLPKSDKPTAIVMYIHGGGFVGGDKSHGHRQPMKGKCLDAKVAFATMNYRFKQHASYQEIMLDGARAIQSLRANARKLNIDPRRIGVYGHSAGAIMSLWLGFHPDVGRRGGKGLSAYSSTVRVVGGLLTPVGTDGLALRYASRGDPPVFQHNAIPFSKTKDLHHPSHAVAVKRRCDQLRISSILLLEDGPKPFKGDPAAAQSAFFFKYLGVVNPDKKKKPADTPVKPDGSSKPRKKNGPDKVRT